MKLFHLIFFAALAFFLPCCTPRNLLSYGSHPSYVETDTYQWYSNSVILRQSIRPKKTHSEYTSTNAFGICFFINADSLAAGKRHFVFNKDTIFCFFRLKKKSLYESQKLFKVVGSINFINWDSTGVFIEQDISIIDSLSNVINKYSGQRNIKRSQGNLKLYFD